MKLGRKSFKKIAFAGTLLASPFVAFAAHAQDAWGVYAASNYGYCDAKKVASVWNKNTDGAKVVIGNKILSQLQHLVDQDIASTALRVRCSWAETQLSYADAQKLGRYWGRSTAEAKNKAASLMSEWGSKKFMSFLGGVLGRRKV